MAKSGVKLVKGGCLAVLILPIPSGFGGSVRGSDQSFWGIWIHENLTLSAQRIFRLWWILSSAASFHFSLFPAAEPAKCGAAAASLSLSPSCPGRIWGPVYSWRGQGYNWSQQGHNNTRGITGHTNNNITAVHNNKITTGHNKVTQRSNQFLN